MFCGVYVKTVSGLGFKERMGLIHMGFVEPTRMKLGRLSWQRRP